MPRKLLQRDRYSLNPCQNHHSLSLSNFCFIQMSNQKRSKQVGRLPVQVLGRVPEILRGQKVRGQPHAQNDRLQDLPRQANTRPGQKGRQAPAHLGHAQLLQPHVRHTTERKGRHRDPIRPLTDLSVRAERPEGIGIFLNIFSIL